MTFMTSLLLTCVGGFADDDADAASLYRRARTILAEAGEWDTSNHRTCLLDAATDRELDRREEALRLMRRAAGIPKCERGEGTLDELTRSRELSRIACLSARRHLERGRPEEAIDDLLAARVMGRRVPADAYGTMVTLLVELAIDALSDHGLAALVGRCPPDLLRKLPARLNALPPALSVSDALRIGEPALLKELDKLLDGPPPEQPEEPNQPLGKGNGVLEALVEIARRARESSRVLHERCRRDPAFRKQVRTDWSAMIREFADTFAVADKDFAEANARFEKKWKGTPAWTVSESLHILDAWQSMRAMRRDGVAREALLRAGIAVAADGPAALLRPEHRDPFGSGPFTRIELDAGFALRGTAPTTAANKRPPQMDFERNSDRLLSAVHVPVTKRIVMMQCAIKHLGTGEVCMWIADDNPFDDSDLSPLAPMPTKPGDADTPRRVMRLWERLHHGKLEGPEADRARRLRLGKAAGRLSRELPAGVSAIEGGRLTGRWRGVAGVITTPAGPIAVCIVVEVDDPEDPAATERLCVEIVRAICRHFEASR